MFRGSPGAGLESRAIQRDSARGRCRASVGSSRGGRDERNAVRGGGGRRGRSGARRRARRADRRARWRPGASPFAAIGSALIDLAPTWAKDAAIALFGTNDKIALLVGHRHRARGVAAAAGLVELRWPPFGLAIMVVVRRGRRARGDHARQRRSARLGSVRGRGRHGGGRTRPSDAPGVPGRAAPRGPTSRVESGCRPRRRRSGPAPAVERRTLPGSGRSAPPRSACSPPSARRSRAPESHAVTVVRDALTLPAAGVAGRADSRRRPSSASRASRP